MRWRADSNEILALCWSKTMAERPSAARVAELLAKVQAELPSGGGGGLLAPLSPLAAKQPAATPPPRPALAALGITTPPQPLLVGSFATSGRRGPDKMEDAHVVTHLKDEGVTLLGVFDGHGGKACAMHCAADLLARMAQADGEAAIQRAFVECDEAFSSDDSGTTALVARLRVAGGHCVELCVANAGDCRLVLARRAGPSGVLTAVRLTREHLASDPDEAERVRQAGGVIQLDAEGTPRVGGLLQVTRSLGDRAVKRACNKTGRDGVVAIPEVVTLQIRPDVDCFIILASDGLFDVMSDQQAVQLVVDTAKAPDLAAKRLGSEAIARGSGDNVTVVVCFLHDKWF